MSTTYSAAATVQSRIYARYTRTDELAPAIDAVESNHSLSLSGAIGDLYADLVYRKTLTADGSPIVIGGSGAFVDPFGNSVGFGAVKAIQIINRATASIDAVEITNVGDFNGLAAGMIIQAGGVLMVACPGDGWQAMGDGDAEFTLTSLEGPAQCDVLIVGTAA